MHKRWRHWTYFATRHQVVHRGSAADAGSACRTVAPLRLHGPSGDPQHAPRGGHGAHVTPHPVGDCRAGDRDVAAGAVIGVLGHHSGDRQQRGRGDRHPRLSAQRAERRGVHPPRQPVEPARATGPHRRRRCARARARHPLTATLMRQCPHHMRAGSSRGYSSAERRRPSTVRPTYAGVQKVTVCAPIARRIWCSFEACATVRLAYQAKSLRGYRVRTRNRAPTRFEPPTGAPLTRGLRHVSGVIRTPAIQMSRMPRPPSSSSKV